MKQRKKVSVEKYLTILKDPKGFISRLIDEQGLYEPNPMKRACLDGGDKSLKMIMNVFDKYHDPEIIFTKGESKGNLCSGMKMSIILACCEYLEENYQKCCIIL